MPTLAIALPTGLFGTTAYPYSITIGWTEVATANAELESIEFEENGDDDPGYATLRLWDATNSLPVDEGMVVRVLDNTTSAQVFLGTVLTHNFDSAAVGRYINVRAVSVSAMLDELLVPVEARPVESDQARVSYLWGVYAKYPLNPDVSLVQLTNATISADFIVGLTLRGALAQTAGLAGSTTQFHLDALGRPVWRAGAGAVSAPFNINVALVPGGGNIAPQDITIERDGTLKNRLYIRGANEVGSGWFQDDASVAQYGPREEFIDAPSADTAAKAQTIAQLQLGKVAQPNIRASFRTDDPNSGWRADQNVTVTSPADDLAAEVLRIVKVTTSFWRGDGKRHYKIDAGKTGARLSGIPTPPVTNNAGSQFGSMFDKFGNPIVSTDQDSVNAGFGAGVRRFLTSGIYNSDFALAPPSTDIIFSGNPLPYWTFVAASGTAVSAQSVPDSSSGSGRVMRFQMAAGAANDEGYIEQIIPVNGSRNQVYSYIVSAGLVIGAVWDTVDIQITVAQQYLDGAGVALGSEAKYAAVGASPAGTILERSTSVVAAYNATVPADAYYLRVRLGLRRRPAGANGANGYIDFTEVYLSIGVPNVYLADRFDPTNYSPARFQQISGRLHIQPDEKLVTTSDWSSGIYVDTRLIFGWDSQALVAGTTILPTRNLIEVNAGGPITLTATPTIADGTTGTMLIVQNAAANAITFQDQGTLANSGLRLTTATFVMGQRDSLTFINDGTDWVEVARANVL